MRYVTDGAAANELVLGMTYRPDGLIETITYPTDGGAAPVVATYEYDRRGRLLQLSGVIDAVDYDLAGRRTRTRYANGRCNGRRTIRRPAGDAPPRSSTAARLRDVEYHHDLLGNLLRSTAPISSSRGRIATTNDPSSSRPARRARGRAADYSYDDAGNLTASSTLGAFRYGEAGAASTLLTTAGTDTFTYDDRGHVQSAPWGTHTSTPKVGCGVST